MNITLIGYKGTGKTTIGRILSKKLQKKMMSTDEEIKKKTKLGVSKYVKKYGWDKFREIEARVLDEICKLDDCIIDSGGGIVLRNENVSNIKKAGLVILLTADAKTIASRIKEGDGGSPLIKGRSLREYIEKVLHERDEKYKMAADYVIDTSNMSAEEVCELIAHYISQDKDING